MRKLLALLIVTASSPAVFADCTFVISNLTNYEFTAQVGFYGGTESTILVQPSIETIAKIKSDYSCNSSSMIGTGRAYVMFPNDPDGAGANYAPVQDGLNFMGAFSGNVAGRYIKSNNGHVVLMDANGKPVNDKSFSLRLNFTSRPNSFSAGTN
jgi:hypothetical protein